MIKLNIWFRDGVAGDRTVVKHLKVDSSNSMVYFGDKKGGNDRLWTLTLPNLDTLLCYNFDAKYISGMMTIEVDATHAYITSFHSNRIYHSKANLGTLTFAWETRYGAPISVNSNSFGAMLLSSDQSQMYHCYSIRKQVGSFFGMIFFISDTATGALSFSHYSGAVR